MEGLGDVVVNGGGEGDATVATTAEDGEVGLAKHDDEVGCWCRKRSWRTVTGRCCTAVSISQIDASSREREELEDHHV